MMLQDLKVDIQKDGVYLFAYIIIKRNGKFYSVVNNYAARTQLIDKDKYENVTPGFINESIQYFLRHCEAIDKEWKVSNIRTGDSVGRLMEVEIDLCGEEKRHDSTPYPYSNMSPFTSREIELMNTPIMSEEEKALFKKRFEEWLNSPKTNIV